MNIAFLSPSISRAAGGIFEIELSLARSLLRLSQTELQVFSLRDEKTLLDLPRWEGISVQIEEVIGPRGFGYSPGLRRAFLNCDAELAHLHALWMYTSILTLCWTERLKRPHLVTLNGMLDTWALSNSRVKKQMASLAYERRNLQSASCIQVNTETELRSARAFGLKNPICVIPNGVDLPDFKKNHGGRGPLGTLKVDRPFAMLYLGRLHPKKNLSALLKAWSNSSRLQQNWVLVIAGWDQGKCERALHRQVRDLELEDHVHFIGAQYGEHKARCFFEADAFVLPSHSEGLPMAVLEAWSYAKPVLMTSECNLEIGFSAGAAVRIGRDAKDMSRGLSDFFKLPEGERLVMGQRGRTLVEERFTWASVALQMRTVYDWVLKGGQRPSCVVI